MNSNDTRTYKPRYTRIIVAFVVLAVFIAAIAWFLGKGNKIEAIQQQMAELSTQLDKQHKLVAGLNARLGKFSTELNQTSRQLYDIQDMLQTQSQTNEYDLSIIQNDIKNIKSRVDTLLMQPSGSNSPYYR
jgi:septal ring factor EnvC (AmiA/AmiB activator)